MATVHRSACPLDCPDLCSLEVEVEAGRVTRIDGDRRNPITDGFICGKVRRLGEHLYGSHRVLTPLRRIGAKGQGEFAPITWDEALDEIAGRLAAIKASHGGEAILPVHYGGSNGWLTEGGAATRLFRRLGASRCERTLCAAPSTAAVRGLYGTVPGVALEDYPHARLIVVWGANPSASGIHLVPIIERAMAAGARLIVVDPRATPAGPSRRPPPGGAPRHRSAGGPGAPPRAVRARSRRSRLPGRPRPRARGPDRGGRAVDPRAGRGRERLRGRRPGALRRAVRRGPRRR
jgi:anaerobic selenocysteine-containing dehydrogenase